MYWLNLDNNGYILSVSETPIEGAACIESLEGLDLEGHRIRAYYWDGEDLVCDEDMLKKLDAKAVARDDEVEWTQALTIAIQEAQALLITAQINALEVDDATALRLKVLYPTWEINKKYKSGDKVQYNDKLFRSLQEHISQANWAPDLAASLWTEICETHAGTMNDPIPYDGNMALEAGKCYTQGGVTYLCTRDTINPVYNTLAELVGIYVEKVT